VRKINENLRADCIRPFQNVSATWASWTRCKGTDLLLQSLPKNDLEHDMVKAASEYTRDTLLADTSGLMGRMYAAHDKLNEMSCASSQAERDRSDERHE